MKSLIKVISTASFFFCCLFLAFSCCNNQPQEIIPESDCIAAANGQEKWAIALHGGAGSPTTMSDSARLEYESQLSAALQVGKEILKSGGTAIEAVRQTVVFLEDCPLFNAGRGAVMTLEGIHELDAAIMDGTDLQAGAVAGLKHIKNPILAAYKVMTESPHVLLISEGAEAFAKSKGLEWVDNSYFSTPKRIEQHKRVIARKEAANPKGTVGCVALDSKGNLAAATSTGGMSGKQWGRVGDVPVIGAGTYANNQSLAVSGTGHGELWIRRSVGFDISALMLYKNYTLAQAVYDVIYNKINTMEGSGGGVICVDHSGNIVLESNTGMMFRAWAQASGAEGTGVILTPKIERQ